MQCLMIVNLYTSCAQALTELLVKKVDAADDLSRTEQILDTQLCKLLKNKSTGNNIQFQGIKLRVSGHEIEFHSGNETEFLGMK